MSGNWTARCGLLRLFSRQTQCIDVEPIRFSRDSTINWTAIQDVVMFTAWFVLVSDTNVIGGCKIVVNNVSCVPSLLRLED